MTEHSEEIIELEFDGADGFDNLNEAIQLELARHNDQMNTLLQKREEWLKRYQMMICPMCKLKVSKIDEHVIHKFPLILPETTSNIKHVRKKYVCINDVFVSLLSYDKQTPQG